MNIGIPTEIKPDERRVALTPAAAREFARRGHRVLVQGGAGAGSGFSDDAYLAAGADLVTVDALFAESELILKVKEPQPEEVTRLSEQHTLFTYLHLAADPRLAFMLADSGSRCIAYETVEDAAGRLPLLRPMSEIAGRLSAQAGAAALTGPGGGRGLLMGGVPGVAPAEVLVLGGGVAGTAAAVVAAGMGARVTIVDRSVARLVELDERFGGGDPALHPSELADAGLPPAAGPGLGAGGPPRAPPPRAGPRAGP